MSTRKTSVVVDEKLLKEVQEVLETRTLRETIERAFLEILRARARREEIEALTSMEELDLDDAEVMRGAWRD